MTKAVPLAMSAQEVRDLAVTQAAEIERLRTTINRMGAAINVATVQMEYSEEIGREATSKEGF